MVSGKAARIAAVLAEDFHALGGDDDASVGVPKLTATPVVEKLEVTAGGDIAIASYEIGTAANGRAIHTARLSVFRKSGERWLVVADGDFGPPGL